MANKSEIANQWGKLLNNGRALRSAEEGAFHWGVDIEQTAPTLIVDADGVLYACIISGGRGGIDMARLAQILDCQTVKLASRAEIKRVTNCQVGAIPLLGLDMPYVMDKNLLAFNHVYGGTGDPLTTLMISPQSLVEANNISLWYE